MIQNVNIKALSLIGTLSFVLIFGLLYAMDNQPDQQEDTQEQANIASEENISAQELENATENQFFDDNEPLNDAESDENVQNNIINDDMMADNTENSDASLNMDPSVNENINDPSDISMRNRALPTPPTPVMPEQSKNSDFITDQPSVLAPTASQLSLQPKKIDDFSKNTKGPMMANKRTVNIGITEANRTEMANALQKLLADEYVLYTKTLNFHWNVEGKHFGPLHALFNDQYEKLQSIIDNIAERIRAIGSFAHATMQEFLSLASVEEKTDYFPDDITMLSVLLEDHERVIQTIRNANDLATKINDGGSNNFLSGLLEIHEKIAWMLRAHLNK